MYYIFRLIRLEEISDTCVKYVKRSLPREEDKIMSGYLGFVAICVTQPLWPHRVPLSFKVSVIFHDFSASNRVPAHNESKRKIDDSTGNVKLQKIK